VKAPALFYRLDDVGKDERPTDFCEALADEGIPLAVAVVPTWLTDSQTRRLSRLPGLTVTQHGYRHLSRHLSGYPDEFPNDMPPEEIYQGLRDGRRRLEDAFGQPIENYVPPWNKVSRQAYMVLLELGFAAVSGHARFSLPPSAFPARGGILTAIPVSVDTARSYSPLRFQFSRKVVAMIAAEHRDPVGVLYHVDGLSKRDVQRAVTLACRLARTHLTLSLEEALARHAG
jgi:hypothetical protein